MGANQSVSSMIKEAFPWVVIVKCSCHMAHLVASYACKKLPKSMEDICRSIYSHFTHSHKRQHAFLEFQKFYQVDMHKILQAGQTRWLSVKAAVDRILEQWDALSAYYRLLLVEDPTKLNELVYTNLNPVMKCMFEFVAFALGLLTEFNVAFQADKPLFYRLKLETESLIKESSLSFMKKDYVKSTNAFQINVNDPSVYLPLENIYLGPNGQDSLLTLKSDPGVPHDAVEKILRAAQSFYIEAVQQIQTRFRFDDDIYKYAEMVDPVSAQSLRPGSLQPFIRNSGKLSWDGNKIEQEWMKQSLINVENIENMDAVTYWRLVFSKKNSAGIELYANLKLAVIFVFTLPFSNVVVERFFSAVKIIKTDRRNLLKTETLRGILKTKYGMKRAQESATCIRGDEQLLLHMKRVKASATIGKKDEGVESDSD